MFPLTCPHCGRQLYDVPSATAHMDEHPAAKARAERDAATAIGLDVVLHAAFRAGVLTPLPPPPPPRTAPPVTVW